MIDLYESSSFLYVLLLHCLWKKSLGIKLFCRNTIFIFFPKQAASFCEKLLASVFFYQL